MADVQNTVPQDLLQYSVARCCNHPEAYSLTKDVDFLYTFGDNTALLVAVPHLNGDVPTSPREEGLSFLR